MEELSDTAVIIHMPDKEIFKDNSVVVKETNENGVAKIKIPRTYIDNNIVKLGFKKPGFQSEFKSYNLHHSSDDFHNESEFNIDVILQKQGSQDDW